MNMKKWAKREVEIACKKENPDRKEGEWDYGCACYESALKAFDSLMEDGHSGFSIGLTKHILNRLIDGKPLTPIEDVPEVWIDVGSRYGGSAYYQCLRMSSLFKNINPDGTVTYSDVNRFVKVININNSNSIWHSGLVDRIAGELFPITMPYMPTDKPYKVYCKDILTDPKNGDFDTVALFYIDTPEGERVQVNRYFKEGSENDEPWTEIPVEEWEEREHLHNMRELQEVRNENN